MGAPLTTTPKRRSRFERLSETDTEEPSALTAEDLIQFEKRYVTGQVAADIRLLTGQIRTLQTQLAETQPQHREVAFESLVVDEPTAWVQVAYEMLSDAAVEAASRLAWVNTTLTRLREAGLEAEYVTAGEGVVGRARHPASRNSYVIRVIPSGLFSSTVTSTAESSSMTSTLDNCIQDVLSTFARSRMI